MDPDKLKKILEQQFKGCQISVDGDGSHFLISMVGEQFTGLSKLKRQQLVYSCVNEQITSGEIHALTMRLYTPAEWQLAEKEV